MMGHRRQVPASFSQLLRSQGVSVQALAAIGQASAASAATRRAYSNKQQQYVVGSWSATSRRPAISTALHLAPFQPRHQHTEPHRSTPVDNGPPPPPPLSTGAKTGSATSSSQPPRSAVSRTSSQTPNASQQTANAQAKPSTSETQVTETKSSSKSSTSIEETKKKQPLLKRAWAGIKHEAQHYWHGTKLLGKEISISARLVRRTMMGYSLTRRERRQLKRTMADILRLIPFVPFLIVPFAELLLPVAIKVFPNMLPSTFESKFATEEKRRGLIKVRLEMAKFLQETIKDGGLQPTETLQSSDEFKEFFRKVRCRRHHFGDRHMG